MGRGGRWGVRDGEAGGPSWRGRIKGVEGLKSVCEGDGGCVGINHRCIIGFMKTRIP